jgi:hypothetical protein
LQIAPVGFAITGNAGGAPGIVRTGPAASTSVLIDMSSASLCIPTTRRSTASSASRPIRSVEIIEQLGLGSTTATVTIPDPDLD